MSDLARSRAVTPMKSKMALIGFTQRGLRMKVGTASPGAGSASSTAQQRRSAAAPHARERLRGGIALDVGHRPLPAHAVPDLEEGDPLLGIPDQSGQHAVVAGVSVQALLGLRAAGPHHAQALLDMIQGLLGQPELRMRQLDRRTGERGPEGAAWPSSSVPLRRSSGRREIFESPECAPLASGILTFSKRFTRWLVVRNSAASRRNCSSSTCSSKRRWMRRCNMSSPSSSQAGVVNRSGTWREKSTPANIGIATPAMFPWPRRMSRTLNQSSHSNGSANRRTHLASSARSRAPQHALPRAWLRAGEPPTAVAASSTAGLAGSAGSA
jgi:hypothetical protein